VTAQPPLAPGAALRWSVVRRMVDELRPGRVLEVGCGQGGFGARLAVRSTYVGVEPDDTSYAIAAERVADHGGRVLHGTVELVDDMAPFDLLCAFEVLEHLADDKSALCEWIARVRPGGHVLVSVPAWSERMGAWDSLVGHYRRYDPAQLDDLLASVGGVEVRHVVYGWPISYALERARNVVARRSGQAAEDPIEKRTAASGRLLQPQQLIGHVVRWGTMPFAGLQRLRPGAGLGLVGVARLPGG
jgi:SAM-dependent methyltransferase